jgi:hypothetical protein
LRRGYIEPKISLEELRRLYCLGEINPDTGIRSWPSQREIATRLGCSANQVNVWVRRLGLKKIRDIEKKWHYEQAEAKMIELSGERLHWTYEMWKKTGTEVEKVLTLVSQGLKKARTSGNVKTLKKWIELLDTVVDITERFRKAQHSELERIGERPPDEEQGKLVGEEVIMTLQHVKRAVWDFADE